MLSKNVKILRVTTQRIDKENRTASVVEGGRKLDTRRNVDLVLLLVVDTGHRAAVPTGRAPRPRHRSPRNRRTFPALDWEAPAGNVPFCSDCLFFFCGHVFQWGSNPFNSKWGTKEKKKQKRLYKEKAQNQMVGINPNITININELNVLVRRQPFQTKLKIKFQL